MNGRCFGKGYVSGQLAIGVSDLPSVLFQERSEFRFSDAEYEVLSAFQTSLPSAKALA